MGRRIAFLRKALSADRYSSGRGAAPGTSVVRPEHPNTPSDRTVPTLFRGDAQTRASAELRRLLTPAPWDLSVVFGIAQE